ncbi:hypothetical protein HQ535_15660 [bacterium]|nr:hypothetical protein [bacterium]
MTDSEAHPIGSAPAVADPICIECGHPVMAGICAATGCDRSCDPMARRFATVAAVWRAALALRPSAPVPPPHMSERVPAWVPDDDRDMWVEALQGLDDDGLVDGPGSLVDTFCQTWVGWRSTSANVRRDGTLVTQHTEKGEVRDVRANPDVAVAEQYARSVAAIRRELAQARSDEAMGL